MARTSLNVSDMTGLWRVKHTKTLIWPSKIMNQINHPQNLRGEAGHVVDMDKPYEKLLCYSQERFLEQVPRGEVAAARKMVEDPSGFPRPVVNALAERKMITRTPMRRTTAKSVMSDNASEQKPTAADSLPGLDQPARSRSTRKPKDDVQDDKGTEL